MIIHSNEAWKIANHFGHLLASDTRTLAALIDDLVDKKIKEAAQIAFFRLAETRHINQAYEAANHILSMQHRQREAPQSYDPPTYSLAAAMIAERVK